MATYSCRHGNPQMAAEHTRALLGAWASVVLPLIGGAVLLLIRPAQLMPGEIVDGAMLILGVASIFLGIAAVAMMRRVVSTSILVPAVVGIVLGALLIDASLGLGLWRFAQDSNWLDSLVPPALRNR